MKKTLSLLLLLLAYTTYAKYNFLFISIDDLRPELNCFGATHIKSPNIDKLASQGRVFTNHFVQVPSCGASRASMLTSKYPRVDDALSHGFARNTISNKAEEERPESFPHLLRRNGYYTVSIGKVSHSYNGYIDSKKEKAEFPYSWDERHLELGNFSDAQKAYENFDESKSFNKNKAAPFECASNDARFPDELNTDLAIKKLDELKARDQAFMLAIGYFKPHLPFNSPKRYWDMYKEEEIALSPQKTFGDVAEIFGHNSSEFNTYNFGTSVSQTQLMPDDLAKKIRHAYYACVSFTDDQVGRLLNALEEKGLAENTIVILWGDHGWHLGDNAIWGKHSLYKRSLNSPLIVSLPKMAQKGTKTDSVVESVDIYPTICDLAGIEKPTHIDGESFIDIINEPTAQVKEYAISFWRRDPQIVINTKSDTLIDMNLFAENEAVAYFDLTKNPQQDKSLAEENPERVKALRQDIVNFLKKHEIKFPFEKEKTKEKSDSSKKKSKGETQDSKSKKSKKTTTESSEA